MSDREFLLGIIHEFKNSVNILSGLWKLFEKTQDKELISQISYEISHLSHIVTRSSLLVNYPKLSISPIQITELLDRVIFLAQENFQKKQIALEKKYDKVLPEIEGDSELLQETFLNLISNGVESMAKGGKFLITAVSKDSSIQIEFTDTGCGIPRDNLSKIFTPFFSTRKEGFGLGLSIVQKIISSHKGKITVKSEEGKGSRFIISLPR